MREYININKDWLFSKDSNFNGAVNVDIPHCYNNLDGIDGDNYYYRDKTYYQKNFTISLDDKQELWLECLGVSMICEVYLNDEFLYEHVGGYSTFRVDLTKHLKNDNKLLLVVDNSYSDKYYPQKADFTFYGGIYRDVNLIKVNNTHFDLDYYGSSGIEVTSDLSDDLTKAIITVETYSNGNKVEVTIDDQTIIDDVKDGYSKVVFKINNPHLWHGLNDPYLYKVKAIVDDVDEIDVSVGIRKYHVDPNRGFILNNQEYRLVGVSKHQDRFEKGYAVSKEDLKQDMDLILELGVTSLRLAHYQHDQYFYDLCDKYGLIVWAEIPYITAHMSQARDNTISQMKELIMQNYNHPSIICWGLSNEITTHGGVNNDLLENHKILNDLVHDLDHTRLSTMAHVFLLKTKEKLVRLTDVSAYNLYYGWYLGDLKQNDKFFDNYHSKYPKSCIGLSEYGADANVQYQTIKPVKGDYSEAYQCLYHEHILKMWAERKYIWCLYAWNMFDFGADGRNEGGKKGQNQKGLVTFDRKIKKDAFYIYKAYFSKEPFIHICGKRYIDRYEEDTIIKAYSNLEELSLYVDGELIETKKADKIFEFSYKISAEHHIEIKSDRYIDSMDIRKVNVKNPLYESDTMKIHNWFDVEVRKGYYSLKDSAFTIKRNKQGKELLQEYYYPMFDKITNKYGDVSSGVKVSKLLIKAMDFIPLEKLFKMLGSMTPLDVVEGLASKLKDIKK